MDAEVLTEIGYSIHVWRVQGYCSLVFFTAIFYYFITTLDIEVRQIWPRPTFKLGRVLYFTNRYSVALWITLDILLNFPTPVDLSPQACKTTQILRRASGALSSTTAEAIFWTCLYALLGAKPKYFALLVIVFLAFLIPLQTLQGLAYAWGWSPAIPRGQLDEEVGFPCNWDFPGFTPGVDRLYAATRFVSLGRTIFMMLLAIVAFVRVYRSQNNRLIRVIRREGGAYYVGTFVLYVIPAVLFIPGISENSGPHTLWIFDMLSWLRYIFADRLLLLLQQSQDPGTQDFVSTIVFDKTVTSPDDSDSYDFELEDTSLSQLDDSNKSQDRSELLEGAVEEGEGSGSGNAVEKR